MFLSRCSLRGCRRIWIWFWCSVIHLSSDCEDDMVIAAAVAAAVIIILSSVAAIVEVAVVVAQLLVISVIVSQITALTTLFCVSFAILCSLAELAFSLHLLSLHFPVWLAWSVLMRWKFVFQDIQICKMLM